MTYNMFDGTLNLALSLSIINECRMCPRSRCRDWERGFSLLLLL